ncbi:hypothetical protein BCR42DRAFT_215934 [Absidia repens]|uniref:Uncharacterized protein n=1 Tax=Absidia repens TaxID=90262 RepID=A0A1X2HFB3_9FUNG|nr:hypothetical protein BCR42DRAFT_215934 [Absidia repens]
MPVCFGLMFVLLEVSLVAYTAFGLVWLQSSLWNQVFDADVVKESTGSPDRGFGSSGTTCLYHALSERDMPVCFGLMFVLLESIISSVYLICICFAPCCWWYRYIGHEINR